MEDPADSPSLSLSFFFPDFPGPTEFSAPGFPTETDEFPTDFSGLLSSTATSLSSATTLSSSSNNTSTAGSNSTTTTSSSTRIATGGGAGAVATITSTVSTTETSSTASHSAASGAVSHGFFDNTPAIVGVFTVVGVIALILVIILITSTLRRSRAKRHDREVTLASAVPASAYLHAHDRDDDDNKLYVPQHTLNAKGPDTSPGPSPGLGTRLSKSNTSPPGSYAKSPSRRSSVATRMRQLSHRPTYASSASSAGVAGVGAARARAGRFAEGSTPYAAFARPSLSSLKANKGAEGGQEGHGAEGMVSGSPELVGLGFEHSSSRSGLNLAGQRRTSVEYVPHIDGRYPLQPSLQLNQQPPSQHQTTPYPSPRAEYPYPAPSPNINRNSGPTTAALMGMSLDHNLPNPHPHDQRLVPRPPPNPPQLARTYSQAHSTNTDYSSTLIGGSSSPSSPQKEVPAFVYGYGKHGRYPSTIGEDGSNYGNEDPYGGYVGSDGGRRSDGEEEERPRVLKVANV